MPVAKMFEPKPTRSIGLACARFLRIEKLGNGPFGFCGVWAVPLRIMINAW